MHSTRELDRLAAHKARLKQKIAVRRLQWSADAAYVARPLDWLDRAIVVYRQISPITAFAALPLGMILKRTGFPRVARATAVLRWMPLAAKLIQAFTSANRPAATE